MSDKKDDIIFALINYSIVLAIVSKILSVVVVIIMIAAGRQHKGMLLGIAEQLHRNSLDKYIYIDI